MPKNGFVIKICVLNDINPKRGYYLPRCIIIFFQTVYDDAIVHIAFLYFWADRSCRNGKDNV